jgi:hypothetical protein
VLYGLVECLIKTVNVFTIAALIPMRMEPQPHRFYLDNGAAEREEQIELILLGLGHDVEDTDSQRSDVLMTRLLRSDAVNPVFTKLPFNVIISRNNNRHDELLRVQR